MPVYLKVLARGDRCYELAVRANETAGTASPSVYSVRVVGVRDRRGGGDMAAALALSEHRGDSATATLSAAITEVTRAVDAAG